MKSFSLFLALRYLKPKRTFISAISVISVLGVTLGIAVMILVLSVMTGFDRELQRKVLGFEAHIVIGADGILKNWRAISDQTAAVPGVVALSPFVMGPVIAEFEGQRLAPKIRAVDPDLESGVADVASHIIAGEFDLSGDSAVLGVELAANLGVGVGDTITIYSPGSIGRMLEELDKLEGKTGDPQTIAELRELVLPAELVVTGIFESGRYQYDSEFILVPLHLGQELYSLDDDVHGITVRTTDPYHAAGICAKIRPQLEPPADAATWMEMNKEIFDALRMERSVMFFILLFIVIVAAFGIMNTLITVTVQKTREIGIFKALGATTAQIIWIFLAQGMVVGVFGNAAGLALGMVVVRWRNEFKDWLSGVMGIELFPPGIYQFSQIPAEVVPRDVALICASAFVICSVAALIPAWLAARMDPVKALRTE